jgi:hypothetical protein
MRKKRDDKSTFFKLCAVSLWLCACSVPSQSKAVECNSGDLMIEHTSVQTLASEPFYTVRITGTVDLPTPNYAYKLEVTQKEGAQTAGSLEFYVKNPDMMTMQVITPITIDDTVKIPHGSKSLMIDVVKQFNWGAEYYRAEFGHAFFTNNSKPICMKAEAYK